MKQRRKQPEATRQAILQAVGQGFASQGYAATGIGEIADRSGLTRGALFHHFHDKQGLAVAWVHEALVPALHDRCTEPMSAALDFRRWKEAGLALIRELSNEHPISLLHLLGSEWARDPVLGPLIGRVLEGFADDLARGLEEGQRAGWIHRSIHAKGEAGLLVAMWCGAALLVRLADDPAAVRARCEQSAAAYLDTMRGGE